MYCTKNVTDVMSLSPHKQPFPFLYREIWRQRKVKTHKLIQLLKLSLYFHCVGFGEKEPNFRFHLRKSVLECEGRIIKCPPIP